MKCTIRVAKTKALISFAVTAKLICVFVFACAKIRFSHNEAHIDMRICARSEQHPKLRVDSYLHFVSTSIFENFNTLYTVMLG